MSVNVWLGDDFKNKEEAVALSAIASGLVDIFKEDAMLLHVLLKVQTETAPLHGIVLTPHMLVILVLARATGVVSGGGKGSWIVQNGDSRQQLRGGIHGNPYIQARKYRFALVDMLKSRSTEYLGTRPDSVPLNKLTLAVVAVNPTLHSESQIKIPTDAKTWCDVVGVDQLADWISRRNAAINKAHRNTRDAFRGLTPKELETLIREVFMTQEAVHVGNTWARGKAAQTKAKTAATDRRAETVVKRQAIRRSMTNMVAAIPARVSQSPDLKVTPQCVVCAIGGPNVRKCSSVKLKGELVAIDRVASAMVVALDKVGNVSVQYGGPTEIYVKPHLSWLEERLSAKEKTTVAVLHVDGEHPKYKMNEASVFLIEPDWLINVTDMTQVSYCKRQPLVKRYAADAPNEAAIVGNAVHQAFRDVWRRESLETCKKTLLAAVNSQALAMVVTATVPDDVVDLALPHVEALQGFAAQQGETSVFRGETFVLSPTLGLKGRIDGVWEREGRPVMVGELKTGKLGRDDSAKEEHVLQVSAYAFMLLERGEAAPDNLTSLLLYSRDKDTPLRQIELSPWLLQKVMLTRNSLVRLELAGHADFDPNERKCYPCSARKACVHIGVLNCDERPDGNRALREATEPVDKLDEEVFQHFGRLLSIEFAAAKSKHAKLWVMKPEEREKEGKALAIDVSAAPSGQHDTEEGLYIYTLQLRQANRNTSELRAGDAVILSGDGGPMSGRCTIATITDTQPDYITVRMAEELVFWPAWADAYTDESLSERMFTGLYRFIVERPGLKQILFGGVQIPSFTRPSKGDNANAWRGKLNQQQIKCVQESLRMDHFLLVNGPPGSGKTTLIARMVQAHVAEGERVLVVASTNRALDQALQKIARVIESSNWLRLGSTLSAANDELREHTIAELVRTNGLGAAQDTLLTRSVVGGTVSTLLSGTYTEAIGDFDLVIVDEATQATIPATLGAISFGSRFVLIGDPRQLPPIVQYGVIPQTVSILHPVLPELGVSLFEFLENRFSVAAPFAIVALDEQYRMNDVICRVPSAMWYEPMLQLRPADMADKQGVKIGAKRLRCGSRWKSEPSAALLDPDRPFLFIDTALDESEGDRTNREEAEVIKQALLSLHRCGSPLVGAGESMIKDKEISVAVISPYRAQVALIRKLLVAECPDNIMLWNRVVDTVDRFQGSEADCVMISLCSWGARVADHVANARRLNVAMTRARCKLLMTGCRSHLQKSDLFKKLFKTCDRLMGQDAWVIKNPCVYIDGKACDERGMTLWR